MTKQRILTDEEIEYIATNPTLSNIYLAEKFGTSTQVIATYKSRMRKSGINIPKYGSNSVAKKIRELAKKLN